MSKTFIFAEQNDPGDSEIIVHDQLFKDGDYVEEGQAIFVVEGSKALFDIEADCSGYITSMSVVGSHVKIGAILAEIISEASHSK